MKAIVALLMAAVLGTLAGCNTVAGFGEDTQAAGRGIERAAEKSKPH